MSQTWMTLSTASSLASMTHLHRRKSSKLYTIQDIVHLRNSDLTKAHVNATTYVDIDKRSHGVGKVQSQMYSRLDHNHNAVASYISLQSLGHQLTVCIKTVREY